MDKHRKAVVELCAAIELAKENLDDDAALQDSDWALIDKLIKEIKASFNHNMQFQYEQHIEREREFRAGGKPA